MNFCSAYFSALQTLKINPQTHSNQREQPINKHLYFFNKNR